MSNLQLNYWGVVNWKKFTVLSFACALVVLLIDVPAHRYFLTDLYPKGHWRMSEEEMGVKYTSILAITYFIQLWIYNYIQIKCSNPDFKSSLWFGLWSGFFVIIPQIQLYCGLSQAYTDQLLIPQIVEGNLLCALDTVLFAWGYRKLQNTIQIPR